jgi:hypothetical protein
MRKNNLIKIINVILRDIKKKQNHINILLSKKKLHSTPNIKFKN